MGWNTIRNHAISVPKASANIAREEQDRKKRFKQESYTFHISSVDYAEFHTENNLALNSCFDSSLLH